MAILIISLAGSLDVKAQTGDWNLVGNTVGFGNFLGSTNNDDIRFRVNNQQRMRLMSATGSLALGNIFNPDAQLHLNLLSYSTNDGRLFRTDGSDTQTLTWRMFSGANVGASSLKAQFLLSPNTPTQINARLTGMINDNVNHLVVESRIGDIVFRAAGANSTSGPSGILSERFRITSAIYDDPHVPGTTESITRIAIPTRAGSNLTEPLAMLHIGDRWWNQLGGHRTWMNTGTYNQRGSDNVFFGLRAREGSTDDDANDAIVAWGDNDTPANRLDALRFVFCGPFNNGATVGTGAHINGLETMRFHPDGTIGMGDFSVNGLNETPTQKLDIDGNVRIRQIPVSETPDVFIVGTQADAATGDYILRYAPFNSIGNDCRWTNMNSVTVSGETDMHTAFDPTSACYKGKVGIGTNPARTKLHVESRFSQDGAATATYSKMVASQADQPIPYTRLIGIQGIGDTENLSNWTTVGVSGQGRRSRYNVGVWGDPQGIENSTHSIGVVGKPIGVAQTNYGVYGEVPIGTPGHSGFFVGGGFSITGSAIQISDASVKNSIENIQDATSMLNALQPKSYYFQSPENREIAFQEDLQFGFIAQEVQEVIPNIVQMARVPEMSDSTGFIEDTSVDLLGIQYTSIIPILVAGFKEQQGIIGLQQQQVNAQNSIIAANNLFISSLQGQLQQQQQQLETLQNEMATFASSIQAMQAKTQNCCQNQNGNTETGSMINGGVDKKQMELGQNVPNPFDQSTRIDFTLPAEAQVILEISDAQGRPIRKLIDGQMSHGQHSFTFDGSGLASGIYYYTIYANGELLTKRMMKF